ncbi:MAG: hypothetical protein IPM35_35355 [Myxococcales bacterium]|nr:hypothetical protein [Myxococcales bacterium]
MTQSLGLSKDSATFPDSIFFASGKEGGKASELSALAKKLLHFHYSRVSPGFGRTELEAAFDAHWASTP